MNYLIIGAGGTGGVLGFYMKKAGKNVTLIARGKHLQAMTENGLTIERMWNGPQETISVPAMDMAHFTETCRAHEEAKPDVIFVCVKGYSIEETVPFIKSIAKESTIVIPILNIYGTGGKLQEQLPQLLVTDGCIYVSANIKEPGVLLQHGEILRVVYGVRKPEEYRDVLQTVKQDLCESGIDGILSENIQRDALEKFSYVSCIGAAGLYFHACAGDFQKEGEPREMFKGMIREISQLAAAMGFPFEKDMVSVNLQILSNLAPEATTSMQRDIAAGKPSEIDGLVFEVIRLGKKYGVPLPHYEKVGAALA